MRSHRAWLDELAAVASNEQLRQFADNPKSSAEQVYSVITGVLKSALPVMGQNFLRTVIDNGRLAACPRSPTSSARSRMPSWVRSDAVVYSAFDIDAAALADLGQVLEKRFGRKLNLQVRLQPELIGGVRVVVGDEVLDTSIKARLEQMKVALTA
jgi:F-type H+-transporting ATPase subunit delta